MPLGSVLKPLLFILSSFELIHIVGNHIEGYADDTTIYEIILRLLSRSQVMEKLNQNFAAINSWCLKRYKRLNTKNTISTVVSRSRTSTLGYGDVTLAGADHEQLKKFAYLWGNLRP